MPVLHCLHVILAKPNSISLNRRYSEVHRQMAYKPTLMYTSSLHFHCKTAINSKTYRVGKKRHTGLFWITRNFQNYAKHLICHFKLISIMNVITPYSYVALIQWLNSFCAKTQKCHTRSSANVKSCRNIKGEFQIYGSFPSTRPRPLFLWVWFLLVRDYVTSGYLLSQIRLSVICLL